MDLERAREEEPDGLEGDTGKGDNEAAKPIILDGKTGDGAGSERL